MNEEDRVDPLFADDDLLAIYIRMLKLAGWTDGQLEALRQRLKDRLDGSP